MESREKLKRVLQEWAEFEPPKIYERDFNWRLLEGREILSVIGALRAGKTAVSVILLLVMPVK